MVSAWGSLSTRRPRWRTRSPQRRAPTSCSACRSTPATRARSSCPRRSRESSDSACCSRTVCGSRSTAGSTGRRSPPPVTPVRISWSPGARSSGTTPPRGRTRVWSTRCGSRPVVEEVRETAAWRRLGWHQAEIRHLHLRELLADDPTRGDRLTAEAAGIALDYSKHLVTNDTLELLRKLAAERRLEARIAAMFRGERVNVSEDRPALHVALRMPRSRSLVVDGVDVVKEVHEELDRMGAFAERLREGAWTGATGRPIRNVVNLGIGGSDLGPAMVYEALRPYTATSLVFRFVANVDPADLTRATEGLDPAETLFVVVSKTMTTLETLTNARAARDWLAAAVGSDVSQHFVGVPANAEAAGEVGILPEQVFLMWDWVGGRTSLCSAVGISLAIALGDMAFRDLLAGFHAMDEHFARTLLGGNVPAIAGLLAVWYRGFFGAQTTAVVPYSHALRMP